MNVLLVAALFILAHQLRYIPSSNIFATSFAMLMRSTIHISILAVWTVSLHRRLMNAQVRRILVGTGILMAFWLAAKTIKYEFLTVNTDPLGRYIWYSYYIPMLLIPLFGVFVVNHIGKPEEYRTPKWMQYLYIPAFLLIAMVLTNDLHQWVFRFDNGYANYDKDYSYGIPYFILMAWYILFVLYFVISLLRKCRVPGSRKTQKLPLIIAFGGIVFWIVYILKIVRVDLTVIDCLIIASLLESAIQCGMIPSNTGHRELFRKTTIPIQILDNDYQPHYVSATALPIHERRLRQSASENVDLGDTLTEYFFKPSQYKNWTKGILHEMDVKARTQAGNKPLFMTEWNSMAVYGAPVHDEKYSAAFLVKAVMDLKGEVDAYMFWCCSDVFEEMFILGKPFHGAAAVDGKGCGGIVAAVKHQPVQQLLQCQDLPFL